MPEVHVHHPSFLTKDVDRWERFITDLRVVAGRQLSAVDPATGEMKMFTGENVGVICVAYDPATSQTTEMLIIQIFGYDWPDRMSNITERLQPVRELILYYFPEPWEGRAGDGVVSLRFVSVPQACWVYG